MRVAPSASRPVFAILLILFSYCVLSVPFYVRGICVCLALTKFPGNASLLYSADLVGAAAGCVLVTYSLKFTGAPTAVILLALLASLAAVAFAIDAGLSRQSRIAIAASVLLAGLLTLDSILVLRQSSPLRVTWAKGKVKPRALYEKWNSFSRITVSGDPKIPTGVINEGISNAYPGGQ